MEKILNIYKNEMKLTEPLIDKINWKDEFQYCEWLAQTFFYVSYSTRIIGLAASYFDYNQNNLHLRFLEHIKEEKSHEKIALSDLAHFGKSIEDFSPSPMAKLMYQNQYYWIQHKGPLSVYGYFLYLEGLSIEFGKPIYNEIVKIYPASGTRYLKVHVEEDDGHMDSHFAFLKDTTKEEQGKIIENMQLTGAAYRKFLEDVVSYAAEKKSKKAKAA